MTFRKNRPFLVCGSSSCSQRTDSWIYAERLKAVGPCCKNCGQQWGAAAVKWAQARRKADKEMSANPKGFGRG